MPYQVTSSYQYSVLTLSDNVSQGKTSLEKVFILVPPGKIKKQRLWYQQHGVWQHARSEKMNIFHSKICTFWAPEWFECLQLCPSAGRWALNPDGYYVHPCLGFKHGITGSDLWVGTWGLQVSTSSHLQRRTVGYRMWWLDSREKKACVNSHPLRLGGRQAITHGAFFSRRK